MRDLAKTLLVVAASILLLGPALGDATAKQLSKASRYCQKAQRLVRNQSLDKAREQYQKALEALPTFPLAHIGLGDLAMAQGDFRAALEAYSRARDGYGEMGSAMRDLQARRYADARREITSLRDSIANAGTSRTNAGFTSLQRSQIENRISQLEAIEPPSDDGETEPPGEIFFKIGNAQFRLGRIDDAVESWEICAEKSESFAMVHNNLAIAYMQKGELVKAKQELARAEELGFPVSPQFKADLEQRLAQQ